MSKELKKQIEDINLEIEDAERMADYEKGAKLKYGVLPDLEKQLEEKKADAEKQSEEKMLQEEVTEDEIAEVISAGRAFLSANSWRQSAINSCDCRIYFTRE